MYKRIKTIKSKKKSDRMIDRSIDQIKKIDSPVNFSIIISIENLQIARKLDRSDRDRMLTLLQT